MNNIAPGWSILHYTQASNGRLWVIWDSNYYDVTLLCEEAQFIHCHVRGKLDDFEAYVTIVYGYNTMEQRKTLWQGIERIAQGVTGNWLIWGDFNAILTSNDRLMGNTVTLADIQDFAKCVTDMHLNELAWKGEYYTWSNKQSTSNRIWSRIDRAFGNSDWMMQWGHVPIEYDMPHISDHAPMFLQLVDASRGGKLPFKYFNIWADHPSFLTLVAEIWRQPVKKKGMHKIWCKLKLLKPVLKELNVREFKTMRSNIDKARQELRGVQLELTTQCSDMLISQEKILLQNLEKWSMIEETVMKERTQRKLIGSIQSLRGDRLQEPKAIQQEILSFYQSLMGSSQNRLPTVDRRIMKQGPTLLHQQQLELCVEVTDQEIWEGLRNIADDKSPGIDGYTACFFKKAWHVVKVDICSAVRDFFVTVLINDSATDSFDAAKGLRQGDPISPYLFSIVITWAA